MRLPPFLLLLLCALALPVHGQMGENDFAGSSHLRAAYGDVPLSPAVEASGRWNVVEYHRVHQAGGNLSELFEVTPGFIVDGAACTCGNVSVQDAGTPVVRAPDVAPGDYVVALSYHLGRPTSAQAAVAIVFQPMVQGPWTAVVYLRQGQSVDSRANPVQSIPGATHAEYTIHEFSGTEGTTDTPIFEVNSQPQGTPTAVPAPATGNPWLYAAVAFVAGCIVWALLVRQGVVQKRTRKQVAGVAAHEEIAAKETPAVLEGKRRALLSALKDVELAHQNKEMDTATYDAVKADFKRQAVTVMRALESGETKKAE